MSNYKPKGWPTVITRLFTEDVAGLVDFVKAVFDGRGALKPDIPTEITIGDSMVLIADGGGLRAPTSAFLYVYVPDIDATYARALKAGATTIEEPADMPYGDRRATVEDRWGNTWQIATRIDL